MAGRQSYDLRVLGSDRVLITGSFRPQAAGGLVDLDTAPSPKGDRGFSVARSSLGLNLVTFEDGWYDMEACFVSGRKADGSPLLVQGGDYSAAAKTLQIRSYAGGKNSIPLDIAAAREIAANDIQNLAAHGGIVASDSVPALARANGATDKSLRLTWANTEVDEIQFPSVPKPHDLDAAQDVTVHLLVSKDANTDTAAVIDVQAWDGVGDTEMGGNTGALSVATLAEYTVTLAAANIAAAPGFLNVGLVPGAHANDTIYLHAAWLEYVSTQAVQLADLADDADNRISFACIFRNTSAGRAAAT